MRVKSKLSVLAAFLTVACIATPVHAQLGGLKEVGSKIMDGIVGGGTGVVDGVRGKDSSGKDTPSADAATKPESGKHEQKSLPTKNCKPDVSQVDKISNEKVEAYSQPLFATSFMGSMWKAQETYITMLFVHSGSNYGIQLLVQKKEGSEKRAVFESQYRAAVGKPIQLGFKDGKPLEIMVTDVRNSSQMTGFLSDSKRLTTTVTLAADLKEEDLPGVREALTNRQVAAVRVQLAGGVEITKDVDDKLGRQLMQKAGCFFDGLELSTAGSPNEAGQSASVGSAASVQGRYVRKGKSSDFLELSHGLFSILQEGRSLDGTYKVQGDTLVLTSPQMRVQSKARFIGDTIKDDEGIVWEKQAEPQKAAAQVTIDQIMQMVTAKLPDDIIITTIQNSNSKFELTPETLIKLKAGGVSEAVIRAMTR